MTDLQLFVSDVLSEVNSRYKESQEEMQQNKNDDFVSGRALAYQEIYEIIQTRLKVYDIEIEK